MVARKPGRKVNGLKAAIRSRQRKRKICDKTALNHCIFWYADIVDQNYGLRNSEIGPYGWCELFAGL
jgi:hypothetical protein